MSGAREAILARIRAATAGRASPQALERRLREHPRGPHPRWREGRVERFEERMRAAAATVARVDSAQALVEAVLDYLADQGPDTTLVLAPHPSLQTLPWPRQAPIEQRPLTPDDAAAMSVAYAGVAETGSLVLLSDPHTPTRYNFLPDTFICLIRAQDLVERLDDLWARLRTEGRSMPRTLNLVTGPSRTADVEQTVQLGAHGPRRLLVCLREDPVDFL